MAQVPKCRKFRPYTQTFTLMLHGCKNVQKLRSDYGEEKIVAMLVRALLGAGWKVMKDRKTDAWRAVCHPFGRKWGYTAAVVLGSSDMSVHCYPEKKFGVSVDIEFNLCFLAEFAELAHYNSLRSSAARFKRVFRPKRMDLIESPRRYLCV